MLQFLREKAGIIGWIAVAVFVATMFTGFFLGQYYQPDYSEEIADTTNELGMIGTTPINKKRFFESFQGAMSQFRMDPSLQYINPELLEMVQYNALNQAIQFTVLLHEAKKNELKVEKFELKQQLEAVYVQLNIKGKRELKTLLKENKYPYNQFISNLKDEILVQKMLRLLQNTVSVDNQDVDNLFTQINVSHILVQPKGRSDEEAKAQAQAVLTRLQSGYPFEEAVKEFSDDQGTIENEGSLGWIQLGDTVKPFEEMAFSLSDGETSDLVKTPFGYHIIRLNETRRNPVPKDFNYEKAKQELLVKHQNEAVQDFIEAYLSQHPLTLTQVEMRAYQEKMKGNVNGAIENYQLLIAKNPNSPIPNYLIGRVYVVLGEPELAQAELEKAAIKGEASPALDIPFTHIELGKLAEARQDSQAALDHYSRALSIAKDDIPTLKILEGAFQRLGKVATRKAISEKIDEIKAAIQPQNTFEVPQPAEPENMLELNQEEAVVE